MKKLNRLKKKAYRDAYINGQIDQGLAYQIKANREARGWDQKELARRIGLKSQSAVARLEDPSYGRLSLSSLKKIASAFDVGLLVKLVPFSRTLTETENLSTEALTVKSFDEELSNLETQTSIATPAELPVLTQNVGGYSIAISADVHLLIATSQGQISARGAGAKSSNFQVNQAQASYPVSKNAKQIFTGIPF